MGLKVVNPARYSERGLWGFSLGRMGRLWRGRIVPSLKIAPDGRAWTFHVPSPLLLPELFARVCDAARREPSPDAWAVAVADGAPDLGAWLLGLFPGEREALWSEARSAGE